MHRNLSPARFSSSSAGHDFPVITSTVIVNVKAAVASRKCAWWIDKCYHRWVTGTKDYLYPHTFI